MSAAGLIRAGIPADCRPYPRRVLSPTAWSDMARALPSDPTLHFVALWADATDVHALFEADTPVIASAAVEAGLYAALSPARPGAALFERAVADLWGHRAADAVDVRPWLDHGTWPTLRPLSERPVPNPAAGAAAEPPDMLEFPGDPIPFGPLPPTPGGPAYWRATLAGGAVAGLEARLGWGHRGIQGLIRGRTPAAAAPLVARIDGAATIAHALAFAHATEAACGAEPLPAAEALRSLMLMLERIAVRLHDVGATAASLGAPPRAAAEARDALLAACADAFGHRLMFDAVCPGGVRAEPATAALAALDAALAGVPPLRRGWPALGALRIEAALAFGVPGPVGRSAGRPDPAEPGAVLRTEGDLAARMALITEGVEADVDAARTALANLPVGPVSAPLPLRAGEGLAVAEGPLGPVWHWARLAGGLVRAWFAAAPDGLLLPALERAAVGVGVDDLAAHLASFGFRPAGTEL